MRKKFINAYSGKIIKSYQRYGLLSRDSSSLGEPYSMKKMVLSLKDINNKISLVLRPGDAP